MEETQANEAIENHTFKITTENDDTDPEDTLNATGKICYTYTATDWGVENSIGHAEKWNRGKYTGVIHELP